MSDFDVHRFVDDQIDAVRKALGPERALIAVSGGVDSTVAAIITHRAIGDNLICAFIDDDFMRLGEPERVKKILSAPPLDLPVKILDERKRFMAALKGLSDAEEKRKAFRETFYVALGDAARSEGCRCLVQGTIKADVIETKGGIKTQHNVLEQIGINPLRQFGFRVIEPIAALYKYQVREVARHLGAPPEISERQPFPGPGLSVRMVGEITSEKLRQLKKATSIIEGSLRTHAPDQYFAAIFSGDATKAPESLGKEAAESLGLDRSQVEVMFFREKATGIIGDERAYGLIAAVKAFRVPAGLPELDYGSLRKMMERLRKANPAITRVLLLVDEKERPGYGVALRAVKTKDFITAAVAEVPFSTIRDAAANILSACAKVSNVYIDVTPKPPATIEFE
jgi:GMP synthase (glutamine-hydrolysing)